MINYVIGGGFNSDILLSCRKNWVENGFSFDWDFSNYGFVCSDGYPDQFGGPDATDLKKIGPKRIRQILVENKKAKMNDVQAVLSNFFESWQGEHKQMDDVLFIGIEY